MAKTFWFDTETTGTNPWKNDIIQIGYMIEIDGEIKEEGVDHCQPFDYNSISDKALEINKFTVPQIKEFQLPKELHKKLVGIMCKYVDKYNREDKFSPAGFNVGFDCDFLRSLFTKCEDKYYGSLVNWKKFDVLSLCYYLDYTGKLALPNYKLETLCNYFGIKIKAHDALNDIKATRELYLKIKTLL